MVNYRPNWKIEKWRVVAKHLEYSLTHQSNIPEKEVELLTEIINSINGDNSVQRLIDVINNRRDSLTSDEYVGEQTLPPGLRDTNFKDYETLDDLKHRLYEHEDNFARGRLSADDLIALQTEIQTREVREREQKFLRTGPPEETS